MDVTKALLMPKAALLNFALKKQELFTQVLAKLVFAEDKLAENVNAFLDSYSARRAHLVQRVLYEEDHAELNNGPGVKIDALRFARCFKEFGRLYAVIS